MKAVCVWGAVFETDWYRLEAIGPVCWDCYIKQRAQTIGESINQPKGGKQ